MNRIIALGLLTLVAIQGVGCSQETSPPLTPVPQGVAVTSVATWIGPEGGVVEQPDCRVIVPAGAVEQNYQVSVLADGPAFQLLPASMEIDGPIEVWLRDPQGNSAQIQQQIELLDPATGAWTVFLGNRVGEWVRVVVDGDHRAYRLWLDLE